MGGCTKRRRVLKEGEREEEDFFLMELEDTLGSDVVMHIRWSWETCFFPGADIRRLLQQPAFVKS